MRSKLTVIFLSVAIVSLSSSAFAAPIPYNGHWYDIVSSGIDGSWINAENNAIALGGHLVTINDATEEAWLRATFGESTRYWIGFNDRATEETWVWVSGEPITYTNWDEGEPSNHPQISPHTDGEDYAVLNWDTVTGQWNDWDHLRPDYPDLGPIDGIAEFGIVVAVDIKPESCPNPISLKNKGVLAVAVLGTDDFDVMQIDPASISLSREGAGYVVPLRWAYEDVATPFEGELCDCHTLGPDGYMDLTLKFKVQEIVEVLELSEVAGETIPLILTGNLLEEYGGTLIRGEDCVWIPE